MQFTARLRVYAEWSVPALLLLSVLWKGGKTLEMTWLLVFVAGVLTLLSWWESEKRRVNGALGSFVIHPVLWGSAMLFFVWTFLSYVFSSTQNYGFDEMLREGALLLLFLWVVRRQGHPNASHILRVIVLATVVSCLIGIAVYVLQPVSRFVGTFFDARFHTDYWPNAFAEGLLLAWPLVLWWTLQMRARWFGALILGFLLGCLLLSYSRGALIVFGGQVVLLVSFFLREGIGVREMGGVGLVSLVTAFLTFVGANALRSQVFPVESLSAKATFTADEGASSFTERRDFWRQALVLASERPLFGWGPYSFRFVQPRFQSDVLATSDHPHNVFLKFAAERGFPAALLFAIVMGFILFSAFRNHHQLSTIHYPLIAMIGVLAHNLIDYNLQFVGIALPFWLLLGLLTPPYPLSTINDQRHKFQRRTELALATLLLVLAVLEGRTLVLSSFGRHAEGTRGATPALFFYDQSKGEAFSRDLHLSRTHLLIRENLLSEAQDAIDAYIERNAEDARAWRLAGELYLDVPDRQAALRAFSEAYRLARFNDLGITRGILETLIVLGDRASLEARREEIERLLQNFLEAVEKNRHFIALGPNIEEFIAMTDLLAAVFPEDAPRYEVLGARVDRKAREERARFYARPPGALW